MLKVKNDLHTSLYHKAIDKNSIVQLADNACECLSHSVSHSAAVIVEVTVVQSPLRI